MSGTSLAHIADLVLNRPLMILPDKLAVIASVLDGRIGIDASELGASLDDGAERSGPQGSRFVGKWQPGADGRNKPYRATEDGLAIIPVHGSLVNRGAWVGTSSGLTSYEGLKHQLASAASDKAIRAVLLDMNSPGGQAVGAFEAAEVVRAVAAVKPVVAVVDGMAASAAYAVAAPATRIVTVPTGLSGSIGVVMLHADFSRKLDRDGITPTLIHAGAHKVDGNPYAPLTGDVRADIQAEIDRFYQLFVEAVAAGRKGLSPEAVRATEARVFMGADAVKLGLADEVGTFETALAELSRAPAGRTTTAGRSASNRGPSMSDTFTQADLDKAKTDAHAAGKAEGLQEGKTVGAAEGRAAALADFGAIVGCEEAKGKVPQAVALAQAGMSLEAAKSVLKVMPSASSLGQRQAVEPGLGPSTGQLPEKPKASIDTSAIYGARRGA